MMIDIQRQLGTWYPAVSHLFETEWMENLGRHLGHDIDKLQPPLSKVFRAFTLTPIEKVKVVIIGQDPYPTPGHADGLAFSSGNGTLPYSLSVIFDRLEELYGVKRTEVTLDDWAEQGVLLLNPILTTRSNEVLAHANIGWQDFTKMMLQQITHHVVYVLWGSKAKEFMKTVTLKGNCHIVGDSHPAAVRHGKDFYGGFNSINEILIHRQQEPIKWV